MLGGAETVSPLGTDVSKEGCAQGSVGPRGCSPCVVERLVGGCSPPPRGRREPPWMLHPTGTPGPRDPRQGDIPPSSHFYFAVPHFCPPHGAEQKEPGEARPSPGRQAAWPRGYKCLFHVSVGGQSGFRSRRGHRTHFSVTWPRFPHGSGSYCAGISNAFFLKKN